MPVDATIIAAMSAAVTADPANVALRLHLGGLLLESGRPAEALSEAMAALAREPAHAEALALAARAAEATGETNRAEAYRRLGRALGAEAGASESRRSGGIPPEEMLPEGETAGSSWDFDLSRLRQMTQGGGSDEKAPETFESENPAITLKDVAGMEAVKRRLHVAFLGPMKNPQLRAMYGKSLRGGLLLYGPPGCGKTFIARATAGELGAGFVSVGLSDVLDMYVGQSERNLHELFEQARRHRPCILFFDEIDAIGRKRSLRRESATRDVVNQLLAEMDSVSADNEGVFVLAATNHPWDVDTALRRPGRLDRTLLVLPPDAPAREGILRTQMTNRPQEAIDFAWLAARTEDFSGADVTHLVESAVENAMEASLTSGRVRPIQINDFKQALKEVRPSVRPWFDTARNYALFANEGGVYDELLNYLRERKLL